MGSLNRATLIGNVGKPPRVSTTANGTKVAQFSLATTEPSYTNKQTGEVVPAKTEWHNVVAWAGLATIVERYLLQGVQVYVEGKIRYRQYENEQNQTRYVTEIIADNVVLLKNGDAQTQQQHQQSQQYAPAGTAGYNPNDLPY